MSGVFGHRPKLPRPVWLVSWTSFFTDTASEMVYPLMPLYLTKVLGGTALSLGAQYRQPVAISLKTAQRPVGLNLCFLFSQ